MVRSEYGRGGFFKTRGMGMRSARGSQRGPMDSSGKRRQLRPRFVRRTIKFNLPKSEKIEYKNLNLLQKYLTDRGKISSRRVTGITAKQQRLFARAIKQARFLALLSVGSTKRR